MTDPAYSRARVVLVDDLHDALVKTRNAILVEKFVDTDGRERQLSADEVIIWHIDNHAEKKRSEVIKDYAALAAQAGPSLMVIDLGLYDTAESDQTTAIKWAREVLGESDSDAYDHLLPAVALVKSFCSGQIGRSVCVASNHQEIAKQKLFARLAIMERLTYHGAMYSAPAIIAEWVRDALSEWQLSHLWRGTDKWFTSNDAPEGIPPHDVPKNPGKIMQVIKDYLEREVLGFAPPAEWFEAAQYENLHKSLNGLTGGQSIFNGNGKRPLKFSNLPLFAIASLRDYWLRNEPDAWTKNYDKLAAMAGRMKWPRELDDAYLVSMHAVGAEVAAALSTFFANVLTEHRKRYELSLLDVAVTPTGVRFYLKRTDEGKWARSWCSSEWIWDALRAMSVTSMGVEMHFAMKLLDTCAPASAGGGGNRVTMLEFSRTAS